MPTDTEVAWFAGVFEGEGTFETVKRSTVRMTVAMSDRDVIERLAAVFPCGEIARREANARFPDAKPLFVWRIGDSQRVTEVITAILPWLGERRTARAQEVLSHIERRQKPGEPRKSHCAQGHPLTPDNLVRRGGTSPYLRCKACQDGAAARYRYKRAAAPNLA